MPLIVCPLCKEPEESDVPYCYICLSMVGRANVEAMIVAAWLASYAKEMSPAAAEALLRVLQQTIIDTENLRRGVSEAPRGATPGQDDGHNPT